MYLLIIDWWFIIGKSILIAAIIGLSFFIAMYTTYAERKVAAWLQDRRGPNRAGPFGILQPLADGGKLFFKEEIIPLASNRFLFILGPALAMVTALVTSTVIPWAAPFVAKSGAVFPMQVADVDMGILLVFSVVSVGVYGIMIGGWASNNKFFVGSYTWRFTNGILRVANGACINRCIIYDRLPKNECNRRLSNRKWMECVVSAIRVYNIFCMCAGRV